jgi:hypothetical protein
MVLIVVVGSVLANGLLTGCSFAPSGSPAGDDVVDDASMQVDANNGDGGVTDGPVTDAVAIDAPVDASVDASIPATSVAIEPVTPENIRSGHPTDIRLKTGMDVVSCVRTSTPPLPSWDGTSLVTNNPFEVAMAPGLNTLKALCTTTGGQILPLVTVDVPAMELELGPLRWNAPAVPPHPAPTNCVAIASPQVNGGLSNGGAYENPGTRAGFNPLGSSEQGFRCDDGFGTVYRATIMFTVP